MEDRGDELGWVQERESCQPELIDLAVDLMSLTDEFEGAPNSVRGHNMLGMRCVRNAMGIVLFARFGY